MGGGSSAEKKEEKKEDDKGIGRSKTVVGGGEREAAKKGQWDKGGTWGSEGNPTPTFSVTLSETKGKKYPTVVGGDDLVFGINGNLIELPSSQVDPTVKLAHYLREHASLKGTKVGCGEGGCGACAVLLSRYDATVKKVVTVSANACLKPLVAMHGYHVTTVEGIGGPAHEKGPHVIQKRFAQLNASQCGFCTPGFVVSTYSQLSKDSNSTMVDMENALDGNLCRCTGYRPILDSAKSFAKDSNVRDDIGGTVIPNDQLQVQAEIDAMFPKALKTLEVSGSEFMGSGVSYFRARSLTEVQGYLNAHPQSKVVCSQTSAGIYKDHLPNATKVCDVSNVPELKVVTSDAQGLMVGGATPISTFVGELMKASKSKGGSTEQSFTALAQTFLKVANVHVRDVGSIAGNISMCKELGFVSDLLPPLAAVGAKVSVQTIDLRAVEEGSLPAGAASEEVEDILQWVQNPSPKGTCSLIVSIIVPWPTDNTFTGCYRTAIRCTNAHAIVNSGFHATMVKDGVIESVRAVYGVVGEISIPGESAPKINLAVDALCKGKKVSDSKDLTQEICGGFEVGDFVTGTYKLSHRQRLVKAFFVQFVQELQSHVAKTPAPVPKISSKRISKDTLHNSAQSCVVDNNGRAIGLPVPRSDGVAHASGSAEYVSDMKEPRDTLSAAWVVSSIAKGRINVIPKEVATDMPGVDRVLTAVDLPESCKNSVLSYNSLMPFPGTWEPRELFSSGPIVHHSQPVGLVLADTQQHAVDAARKLSAAVQYTEEKPIVTIEQAIAANVKPSFRRPCVKGNAYTEVKDDDPTLSTLKATINIESQKHFYMETHSAFARIDDRKVEVWCGTQMPMYVHKAVSEATGMPHNQVEVRNHRIGGSFGGKVTALHACGAAVAAKIMNRPVKLHLERCVDSHMQGGREETRAEVEVKYKSNGLVEAIKYDVWMAPGYFIDSAAVPLYATMPPSMFSPYKCPNHVGVMHCMRTNIAPRSWFRAPGEVQSAFIQEEVMDRLAFALGRHAQEIREVNMCMKHAHMKKGDVDSLMSKKMEKRLQSLYVMEKLSVILQDNNPEDIKAGLKDPELGPVLLGVMKANAVGSIRDALGSAHDSIVKATHFDPEACEDDEDDPFTLDEMYDTLMKDKGWRAKVTDSQAFNEANKLHKKGVAICPIAYHMIVRAATAMVNVYADGSVLIHHGGVEMGQGLIEKVLQGACTTLSKALVDGNIPLECFQSAGNNSSVLPLQGFTGASTSSESNVQVVQECCEILLHRLGPAMVQFPVDKRDWKVICARAYEMNINLAVQHTTPEKDGDWRLLEYVSFCLGACQIDLDVFTGEVVVERFDIQYDSAKSMNPAIDIGQMEGAFMQGLGYMLQEDTHLNKETGAEEAPGTWDYKPPFAINVPREFNIDLYPNSKFKAGIMSSKACGEPPLCVAPAITSAVHQAVQSARKDNGLSGFAEMSLPFTPWKVAEACGGPRHMVIQ